METPKERGFWKRVWTSSVISWVGLAVAVAALVTTLPHSTQAPSAKLPKPPDGFLLDPRKAKVTDSAGNTFSWHEEVGDNMEGDHINYGGWVADGNRLDYVAYGRAFVRGVMKSGIVVVPQLDAPAGQGENRIHIEWPVKVKAGQELRFTCSLTDRSRQLTHDVTKIRVELRRKGLSSDLLADDEPLKPGDDRVIEIVQPLSGMENCLVMEVDNSGSQFWSVVFCNARLESIAAWE